MIAPLLSIVFFACVVRLAQAAMSKGCGVKLSYHAIAQLFGRPSGTASLFIIPTLLCADDVVLMSCCKEKLECMLKVVNGICNATGTRISAGKTDLMVWVHLSDGSTPECAAVGGGGRLQTE